jgi:hypothetical protein
MKNLVGWVGLPTSLAFGFQTYVSTTRMSQFFIPRCANGNARCITIDSFNPSKSVGAVRVTYPWESEALHAWDHTTTSIRDSCLPRYYGYFLLT